MRNIEIMSDILDRIDTASAEIRQQCSLFDREPSDLRNLLPQELEIYASGREQVACIIHQALAAQTEMNRVLTGQKQ